MNVLQKFRNKGAMILVSLSLLVSCKTTPVTDRSQLILIPESQEIALGLTSYQQILSESKLSDDPEKVAMLRRVGEKIAAVADRPDYEWEFNLIEDDKQANAFALPGGKVAVYTGILPLTQTEAGLATVLAHEVAHATARHGGERISTGLLAQLGMTALNVGLAMRGEDPDTIKAWTMAYGAGAQVGVLLPFSRKQESEADRIGLIYMAQAGYDPEEALHFWERMSRVDKESPPEFLATHPSDETRIKQIAEWLPEAKKEYLASAGSQKEANAR